MSMMRCVRAVVEADRRDLAQVEPERVRRLALLVRVGRLLGHAGQLGVALPRGRLVGPAVQREARVALQVEGLDPCHIEPISSSPSSNLVSMPEIRGEPSRRIVAMVLWVCASRRSRTRAASSGAAASNSDQLGMRARWRTDGATSSRTSKSIKLCAWPTACAS